MVFVNPATYVLCKAAGNYYQVDIVILFSEFVAVAILSEWWSVPTTVGTSLICSVLKLKWVLLGFCLVLAKPETSLAQLCNTTNPILCVLLGSIDLDLLFFIGGWL